jgi:hypothetical protein
VAWQHYEHSRSAAAQSGFIPYESDAAAKQAFVLIDVAATRDPRARPRNRFGDPDAITVLSGALDRLDPCGWRKGHPCHAACARFEGAQAVAAEHEPVSVPTYAPLASGWFGVTGWRRRCVGAVPGVATTRPAAWAALVSRWS